MIILIHVFTWTTVGCNFDVMQEWQKEEMEALKPKEQGSSTFSHYQKEKHCFFLFSLIYVTA